jgi:formate hydrogenlyase subunit 3/multisubunit Na+/H+ antiporter MnhD subunit
MDWRRFGVLTAVGTVAFYAAAGAVVYYGRRESLFTAVAAAATNRPALAVVAVLALVGLGLVGRTWVQRRNSPE